MIHAVGKIVEMCDSSADGNNVRRLPKTVGPSTRVKPGEVIEDMEAFDRRHGGYDVVFSEHTGVRLEVFEVNGLQVRLSVLALTPEMPLNGLQAT